MSVYTPITFPAWTYALSSALPGTGGKRDAYHIPFDNFDITTGGAGTTLTLSSTVTTILTETTVYNNTWMEMVLVVNATVSTATSATTVDIEVLLDNSVMGVIELGTAGFMTVVSAATALASYYAYASGGAVGFGLTPGKITSGTHTIVVTANGVSGQTLLGTGQGPMFGILGGNIVVGSGYNEPNLNNPNPGYYTIPTLTGSEARRVNVSVTSFPQYWGLPGGNSGTGGYFYLESKNGTVLYGSIKGSQVLNIEEYTELADTSSVLRLLKNPAGGGSPASFLVLMSLDIEEGDYTLTNYPFSDISE